MKKEQFKHLGKLINAPQFIVPWLGRFYEPLEIKIIKEVQHTQINTGTLQKRIDLTEDSFDRLFKRAVLCEDKSGNLMPCDFHKRFDIWALFEGFKDIPSDIRKKLNQWEINYYIKSHKKSVDHILKTGKPDPSRIVPRYLLLEEAFEVIDQVERIFLWPCNCRSMIKACNKPLFTCLRFHNSQGQGFEISREKAKEIILKSNKKGLMQSGELGWDTSGRLMNTGAICNCCPDCCFPHLLARNLKVEKLWPVSCYIAHWIEKKCSLCGLCTKRCPFQAFKLNKSRDKKNISLGFSENLCRGCGLCAVTCPDNAIEMKKIKLI